MLPLDEIITPAYVADIAKLKRNLEVVRTLKAKTGCKVLLALKAFSQFSVFDNMREYLDGTTASGLYEARLGAEEFGKEVHVYSPAYKEADLLALLDISDHIYFNHLSQLSLYADIVRKTRPGVEIAIRANAELSQVRNSSLYDPSASNSRYGVRLADMTVDAMQQVDMLHFHNLCENLAEDSARLIDHVSLKWEHWLKYVKSVNFGGGHYITHPDYKLDILIDAIERFGQKHDLQVVLELGGALVLNAGYLVGSVLDIVPSEVPIALLDVSACCHMPDVLEVPYRPEVEGSGRVTDYQWRYVLAGSTCMSGDVIGEYSFPEPLSPGTKLIFHDMLQYSMVKNTTFNGTPLPSIAVLTESGKYVPVKTFGYEDFKSRQS